jgi:hypothetical protein
METNDNGFRIIKVLYPFMLPWYYQLHHTKMENELVRLILMVSCSLDKATAAQLMTARFVNNTGTLGGNVPVDLDNGNKGVRLFFLFFLILLWFMKCPAHFFFSSFRSRRVFFFFGMVIY